MARKSLCLIAACTMLFMAQGLVFAEEGKFRASYEENRITSCIHYFFSLFERNPRDAEKLAALLVSENLQMKYPWAEFNSQEDFRKWVSSLPNEFQDAHHIRSIKVEAAASGSITAIADVFWENRGPKGEYDSAHLEYRFEFTEDGSSLPKINRLFCRKL